MNKSFFILFLTAICFDDYAYGQKEFHIQFDDTNYYHWIGPVANDAGYPILDGVYGWFRNENAPDGKYYIYYPYRNGAGCWEPPGSGYYQVMTYADGRIEGYARKFSFPGDTLLAETFYVKGQLRSEIQYMPHPERSLGCNFGYMGYERNYYPFSPGESITKSYDYDSLGNYRAGQITISSGDSTKLIYEKVPNPTGMGYAERTFYLDETHRLMVERLVGEETLVLKRWCEDGSLYYHLEEKIRHTGYGNWFTLASNLRKDMIMVGGDPRLSYCEQVMKLREP